MNGIITITTDFGDAGGYVGIMKGVILGINPNARIVDISHSITPQNILEAQFILKKAAPYFPPGTVHLAVVDPGVGSARRELIVRTGACTCVGPDNGLLSPFCEDAEVFEITEKEYCLAEISSTFHGRDIFASVAAHLSTGVPPDAIGPVVTNPVMLTLPVPTVEPRRVVGEVIFVDRFGNLITNIHESIVAPWAKLSMRTSIGGNTVNGIVHSYAAPHVSDGTLIVVVGSTRHLEVAVVNGSAADRIGVDVGTPVTVTRHQAG